MSFLAWVSETIEAFRAVGIPYPEIALLSVFFVCLGVVLWYVLIHGGEQNV